VKGQSVFSGERRESGALSGVAWICWLAGVAEQCNLVDEQGPFEHDVNEVDGAEIR